MIDIQEINSVEHIEQIANFYNTIWKESDWNTTKERFLKHSGYEGFKGFIIKNEEGNSVGFI